MMLRYGLGDSEAAGQIEAAVDGVLADGLRTPDLYSGAESESKAGTEEVTSAVLAHLAG
jgi:3-isopropylmalate dehydrogenase